MTSSCGLNESTSCPGICGSNFKCVISEHILQIKLMNTCEIAPRWILLNTFDDQSSLIQVMAWCRQETSHCLIQFWSDLSHYMSSLGYNELTHWCNALLASAYAVDTLCVTFVMESSISKGNLFNQLCLKETWKTHLSYFSKLRWPKQLPEILPEGRYGPVNATCSMIWPLMSGPLLLTWSNFNPSMNK